MQVGHIVVTQADTVGFHGSRCVELTIGGRHNVGLLQVVMLLDAAMFEENIRAPLVVVDGFSPADYDPNEVMELVEVLASKGYTVLGKTSGLTYPRWLNLCHYKVAYVDNQPWMLFGCNEVIYLPREGDRLAEPLVGAANLQAVKVLNLNRPREAAELADFFAKAQQNWSVLTPKSFVLNHILLEDEN